MIDKLFHKNNMTFEEWYDSPQLDIQFPRQKVGAHWYDFNGNYFSTSQAGRDINEHRYAKQTP